MDTLPPLPFVAPFKNASPEFGGAVEDVLATTFAPSALELKAKLLIAIALDVAFGTPEGTANAAAMAREAGATDAEIVDAVKVSFAIAGVQRLAVGVAAISQW